MAGLPAEATGEPDDRRSVVIDEPVTAGANARIVVLSIAPTGKTAARPALAIKRDGQYRWLTLARTGRRRAAMAARLLARGVEPGDRVVLVSENRYEWMVCDLAVHLARRHPRGRARFALRSANCVSDTR